MSEATHPTLPEESWPDVRPDAARRLMAAAVESFAKRGYHATTTRDIATAAGMSPAALYVHFPAKSAVLFAISRSGHERTLKLVQTTMAEHDDPGPRSASLAQSLCSTVAVHAAEEAVQLHGGIGMTWDHPAHLYLKRAKADSIALGTAGQHRQLLAPHADILA